METKVIAAHLHQKYAETHEVFLRGPARPYKSGSQLKVTGEKRTLEIQLGPGCNNTCHGCYDVRDHLTVTEEPSPNINETRMMEFRRLISSLPAEMDAAMEAGTFSPERWIERNQEVLQQARDLYTRVDPGEKPSRYGESIRNRYNLPLRPADITRIFELLGIKKPGKPEDRWRIVVSGSQTDPCGKSFLQLSMDDPGISMLDTWERLIEQSAGHTIVMHTSEMSSSQFRRYLTTYFRSSHWRNGGNMVLTASLNAPVSDPATWSYWKGRDNIAAVHDSHAEQYYNQFHCKQDPNDTLRQFAHEHYEQVLENARWLKEQMNRYRLTPEQFTFIAKQTVDLESKSDASGHWPRFSIDMEDSIPRVTEAINFWSNIAHMYRLSPSYIYDLKQRIPLQERFASWLQQLEPQSFHGTMDVAYRVFTAKPQKTRRSGVSMHQYTVNPWGYFTPCDYSIHRLPLLNIPLRYLTKEMIDDAYARVSYSTEPCRSCDHHSCFNDTYAGV